MSIVLQDVTYTYMPKTSYECTALKKINMEIPKGKIIAIAGHTGSGKSTLIQQFNGLLKPSSGKVLVDGVDISQKNSPEAREARLKVGVVFQYPEQQLFGETVEADIGFGPKNIGLSEDEILRRVKKAMNFVGLDYNTYAKRIPFQLSGGQMRRIAIAGIIALEPAYLVLDEPVAGLDPRGREELLSGIIEIHKKQKVTIVFISHNMEDIARLADKVFVMRQGEILLEGTPQEVFSKPEEILSAGLLPPMTTMVVEQLREAGFPIERGIYTVDEAVKQILNGLRRKGGC